MEAQKLVISKPAKKNLNKDQKSFNSLIKKLEKLRSSQRSITRKLDDKLDYYVRNMLPIEETLASLHSQCAKILYKLYHKPLKLSKSDKESLQLAMGMQIREFFTYSREGIDDELKEIFEFAENKSYEESEDEQFQEMKWEMEDMLRGMGVDVDMSDLSSKLTEDEMIQKMGKIFENMKEQVINNSDNTQKRKKTKHQIEKENLAKQIEEARKKSIGSIYRQLARVLHPDLEQDIRLKTEKESLMKELTVAYEKEDLHTLLRLELEWIHKEEGNLVELSDHKLKIYNQVLKEQIKELETEIELSLNHPRYFPLQKYAGYYDIRDVNLISEQIRLEKTKQDLEKCLKGLKSDNPKPMLKEVIVLTREQELEDTIFEGLDFFF